VKHGLNAKAGKNNFPPLDKEASEKRKVEVFPPHHARRVCKEIFLAFVFTMVAS
jgi:hypothetical protein